MPQSELVGLHVFSVHHGLHGLAAVEKVSRGAGDLAPAVLAVPGVRGAVVVSTCNRVEVYVDAAVSVEPQLLECAVARALSAGGPLEATELPLAIHRQHEVLRHLFRVASGLDSMVIGEREIAGQLRRALTAATAAGQSTYPLTESFERALRTSRKVAQLPELAAAGRSIVAVALDLAAASPDATVLLIGTGAYAGASLAALRQRGIGDVAVFSPTGRAPQFAASHDCTAVPLDELPLAAAGADLIISCRGAGTPLLTRDFIATLPRRAPLTIVDLALQRDTEPQVGEVEGVTLVDLGTIQAQVPDVARTQLREAFDLVHDGVQELEEVLTGRQMDPAVVALADTIQAMVDDEIARLPQGRPLDTEDAAHALRRLAARLIHGPRMRARQAAIGGRAQDFLAGLEVLYGIEASLDESYAPHVDPATLDAAQCPATGLVLDDLRAPVEDEVS